MTRINFDQVDLHDLYDMLVDIMNELIKLEDHPGNSAIIMEKKERVLMLQNAIYLKKLERS